VNVVSRESVAFAQLRDRLSAQFQCAVLSRKPVRAFAVKRNRSYAGVGAKAVDRNESLVLHLGDAGAGHEPKPAAVLFVGCCWYLDNLADVVVHQSATRVERDKAV